MSEPTANPLTSNEFEAAYRATPPWEIGKPQPAFLEAADRLRGRVLDSGCGTGELAMMAAGRGLDATGIDAAPTAIRIARQRAAERGLAVEFILGDVLKLAEVTHPPYDTVVDSGLLHVFAGTDRERYVAQVAEAIAPGGLFMALCFSDRQPGTWGPHRLNHDDLLDAFARGWRIESIEPTTFVMADLPNVAPQAQAYFVRARRNL
ncbi:MAG TPA: class I SAM-dependent methyltransferase [Micromonosporaceae bacterium]|jgi:SAM-dependent methyltransferase